MSSKENSMPEMLYREYALMYAKSSGDVGKPTVMKEWTMRVLKMLIKKDAKSFFVNLEMSIVCNSFAETQN